MKKTSAEQASRPYKLSHQRLVITGIDFEKQLVTGYTELTIYPLCKLSSICLNSRQTRILCASIAGISVPFECNDPQTQLTNPSKKRALDGFASSHQQALNSSHLDLGGKGELLLKLPPDVLAHVHERKPVDVVIEFTLEKPKGGLHFVSQPADDTASHHAAHLFSYQYGNSSRLWFPCVDMLSEVCTWHIEVTVPVEMTAVCCGQLQEQILSDDERQKTFVFSLSVPTSACNIGISVGVFEIVPDPKIQEMMYFCPPGLAPLVRQCTSFMHEAFGFYEDCLSARFPYNCYQVVFVDEAYENLLSFAGFSIVSLYALHSPRYIEQTVSTRQLLSLALAQQYFGCFLCPKSWNEVWLSNGAALYLQLLFQRRMFGNSHFRCVLKKAGDFVCQVESTKGCLPALHPLSPGALPSTDRSATTSDQDSSHSHPLAPSLHLHALHGGASAWTSDSFGHDRIRLQQAMAQKSMLVMHMLSQHTGQDCVVQAFNKLLALGLSASQQSIIAGSWNHVLLTTDTFVRAVSLVSGKTLDSFLNQWVYQSGAVKFLAKFSYNRKRNALELLIQQDNSTTGRRFVGPLTVTMQELDGPFQHVVQIEAADKSYEIACHSKARRTKKKRISLVTGEEIDMDLSVVESDSPILWLRLDPDMAWLRTVQLEAPDYMWQLQVLHERDVVGQIEACEAVVNFPTPNTRKALGDAICHQRFFYQVRCSAAHSLATVISNSQDVPTPHSALTGLYRKMYGCNSQRDMVRLNDFTNFADYYVQKEIPLALAAVRNAHGHCPKEIVSFLSNLLKHNDNRCNKYSDVFMIVALLDSLAQTISQSVTPAVVLSSANGTTTTPLAPEAAIVLNEIVLWLNMDKLIPSFSLKVTCSCLSALDTIAQCRHISGCMEIFRRHSQHGVLPAVRLVALRCLVNCVKAEGSQTDLLSLLDFVENDPNPAIRIHIVRMLVVNPPFTRQSQSPLNTEAVVDRLWHLLTTSSALDMQLRCSLAELFAVLYGWLTPSCLPASGLGLVIDLKKKKSRTHMLEQPSIEDTVDSRESAVLVETPRAGEDGESTLRLKIKVGSARPSASSSPLPMPTEEMPMDIEGVSVEEGQLASPLVPPPAAQLSPPALSPVSSSVPPVTSAVMSPVVAAVAGAPLVVKSHKRSHSEVSKKDGEKSHKKHKKEKHKHKHKHKHHRKDGESSKKPPSQPAAPAV